MSIFLFLYLKSGLTILYFMVSKRSKSLALHAVRSRSINSDTGEDSEIVEFSPGNILSSALHNQHPADQEAPGERKGMGDISLTAIAPLDRGVTGADSGQSREKGGANEEQCDADGLFIYLRDNMETIREFCKEMVQQIPVPEQCVVEGNVNRMTDSSECMRSP